MNTTDYNILNNLYTGSLLLENKQEDIDDLQKLHDDPDEKFAIKNYGSVEAYKKMIKNKIKKLKELDEATQRPKDENSSDKLIGDGPEVEGVHKSTEESERDGKKGTKSINNSKKVKVMHENKTIFDKLYEQVMGEAEDENMELGIDTGDMGDEGDDIDMDLGGDGEEITIKLTPDHVQLLRDILDQVEPGDDEGMEDEEGMDDSAEEMDMGYEEEVDPFEEETKHTKDGTKTGVDPSDGGGKSTELPKDALGGKTSGTGNAAVTDKTGTQHTTDGKVTGKTSSK